MDPEDMPPQTNRVFGLSILSLVIVVLVLTGIVYFAQKRVRESRETVTPQAVPVDQTASQEGEPRVSAIRGRLGLSTKGATGAYRVGDKVTLFVYADSNDVPITGYDALVRFDSRQVSFDSVTPLLDGMDTFETVSDLTDTQSEVIITGIKGAGTKNTFVFDNTALVEVTFTVRAAGPTEFTLGFEPGSSKDSNLMNTLNQDILGGVEGTTITVN